MPSKNNDTYLSPVSLNIENHIVMLPCGALDDDATYSWTFDDLLPYTSYLSEDKALDRMFGGFIFNGICTRKNHYIYPLYVGLGKPSDKSDWSKWIDVLFKKHVNLAALSQAVRDTPLDVWISIPFPHPFQDKFGVVGGVSLNFNIEHHRILAVRWWIEMFLEHWEKKISQHDQLRLRGFLWQRESIDGNDETVVRQTNAFIHKKGYLSMWLPNHRTYGVQHHKSFGFDVTAINPNYYGNTSDDYEWINRACHFAKTYHTGIQINYGKGFVYNDTHLLDYLNLGLRRFNGYMKNSLLVYQFPNQKLREVYEQDLVAYIRLYTFIKRLYKHVNYPGISY